MNHRNPSLFAALVIFCGTLCAALAVDYSYDTLQRLTRVDYDNGVSVAYSYDAAGNRLSQVVPAASPARIVSLAGSLAFGNVATGTTATALLTIGNSGNTALSVNNINYPAGFSGNWNSGTIPVGGTRKVTVTFAPTATTAYGGTVTVNSDATGGSGSIAASGTGVGGLTLAAALDAPGLSWTSGGGAPWTTGTAGSHDGVDVARSGVIGNGQLSYLETTVTGPGTLTFWWLVSSESGGDFLRFSLNGAEVSGLPGISGSTGWAQAMVTLADAGSHVLRWSYVKDGSTAVGADAGWVDQVTFTPTGSGPDIAVEQPAGSGLPETGASVGFGSVSLGAGIAKTFTIRNFGTTDLTELTVSSEGANTGDFTVGSLGATTLAPSASTTFTVTFAPKAPGARAAAIRIGSSDAKRNPFTVSLTGTGVATALQAWRLTWFGSIDNSGPGADLNDFEKDGGPNLLEYATGGNPLVPDLFRRPKVEKINPGDQDWLAISFRRLINEPALLYQVQESGNLDTWHPVPLGPNLVGTPVNQGDGTEMVTVRAPVPLAASRVRWLRLAVAPQTDQDGDGMDDSFEQRIADAKPGDAITGPAQVSGSGDFDGDGVTDLREFLFGMDPVVAGQRDRLPFTGNIRAGGQDYLAITYRRLRGVQPAHAVVQESTDLVTWGTADQALQQVGFSQDMGDGTERITVRASVPLSTGPRRYLRVTVALVP